MLAIAESLSSTMPMPTLPCWTTKCALFLYTAAAVMLLLIMRSTQGYPRADIDVAAIRSALHRIAVLRNDLAHITSLLGKALEGVFVRPAAVHVNGHSSAPMDLEASSTSVKAFAKVNSVSNDSPASQAVSSFYRQFESGRG